MRSFRIAALAAAALLTAVMAASAQAAPAPAESDGGALVTPIDRSGRPLGPAQQARPTDEGSRTMLVAKVSRTPAAKRSLQSASGCLQLDVWKDSYSFLFHALVYRWHQVKSWCWSGNRITSVNTTAYPTNVDPNWYYRGLASSAGWYYNWCCGISTSGHYSLRQARMENCVLKFGCIGSEYPWVKIWVHGDGSYDYQWGS